jgi:hypothetical protein
MTMTPKPFPELDFGHITLTTPGGYIEGIFSDLRVDVTTIPDGLIPYSIRHRDDDDSVPATIETCVVANYFGTLIVDEPLYFDCRDHIEILDWNFKS